MTTIKSIALILCIFIIGCKQNTRIEKGHSEVLNENISPSPFLGDYVSDGYSNRDKGYDWVAVSVKKTAGDDLLILVNSRDDIKKPTCTFEALALKKDDSTYVALVDDKNILFTFNLEQINISTEKPEESNFLYSFCNGGATLAGNYSKIIAPLN